MKVLVSDKLAPEGLEVFRQAEGLELDVRTGLKPEELKQIIREYDGLAIRSSTKVTKDIIEATEKLKVIGRAGIGVDNVDLAAATGRGIVVMNTPGGNAVAAAEHTLSLMLALARNIPQANASMKSGKWDKSRFMGIEVCDKVLGVIGLGNIGRIVAERALGLKMKVISYDPFITTDAAAKLGIEMVDIDTLLAHSDFITIHTPRTDETKNLIRKDTITKMKHGVRIINCARGGIVNEADLLEGLESGKIAGAALDVFEKEPPEPSPLFELPNVILTPHLGASTDEAQVNVSVAIARQMVEFLLTGTITNAVNFPSLSKEALQQIQPYLNLAERMGKLTGQLLKQVRNITVEYSGEVTDLETRPITLAVLKGLLTSFLDVPVNYVSAQALARERGINVQETTSFQSLDFTSLITLKVKDGKPEVQEISGTLFGKNDPRIVYVDGIYLDAIPEGAMLIIHNHDRPGVIGNIGTTLGKNNINIGRFQLGRKGGEALCMVNIDAPASEQVLEDLHGLPNIISVRQVRLD
jgi:D-3-phosphoglycerate dehydrogenase